MQVRRVVTGHDRAGKAVVSSDEEIVPLELALIPGFGSFELWHTDATPAVDGGDGLGAPGAPSYFPPVGGSVLRICRIAPDASFDVTGPDADADRQAALAEANEKIPALMAKLEPGNPGMHTTDSVDYGIVLSGELELELDDGQLTTCRPGTVVVQRATRHAWRNRSGQDAYIAFVVLGAEPRTV